MCLWIYWDVLRVVSDGSRLLSEGRFRNNRVRSSPVSLPLKHCSCVCLVELLRLAALVEADWAHFPHTPLKHKPPALWLAARVCVGGLGLGVLKQEMKGLCNESSRSVGVLGYSSVIRTSDGKCTQNKTCRLSGIMRNVSVDVFVNVSCVRSCESHTQRETEVCVDSSWRTPNWSCRS